MTMKRIWAGLLALGLGAMLFSCGKSGPAEIAADAGVDRYTDRMEETEPETITFTASYSRTDHHSYINRPDYPLVTVLSTRADLEKYTADYEGLYNFYASYYDLVTPYDAAYFEENVLVMILVEESSGGVRHEVADITHADGQSVITINRILEEPTEDTAEWHILVELPKDSPVLENTAGISVQFKNVASATEM